MINTRLVSFDLDGTLTDASFADSVWLEGIPRLYAVKHGVSFQDAKAFVKSEYDKVGRNRLEWYDPSYWIGKFVLDVPSQEILNSFRCKIEVFPEVRGVLKEFKEKGLRQIIVSNARREFLNLELEETRIGHYFERVFSSTSDFRLTKKTVDLYQKVCSICGVYPGEMMHVGDDRCFDFDVPKKLGITTFHLDRTCMHSGESTIHSLKELADRMRRL